jgi:hypothetical protein
MKGNTGVFLVLAAMAAWASGTAADPALRLLGVFIVAVCVLFAIFATLWIGVLGGERNLTAFSYAFAITCAIGAVIGFSIKLPSTVGYPIGLTPLLRVFASLLVILLIGAIRCIYLSQHPDRYMGPGPDGWRAKLTPEQRAYAEQRYPEDAKPQAHA